MKGTVFSIEEFSVYDGPGIRTSVFLKGCPLRCSWCHNPEGQHKEPEIVRSPNGCLMCGKCEEYAEKDGDVLRYTTESINNCPRNLLRLCGTRYEPDELCQKLLKNKIFFEKGGGVTFSGGEPFCQPQFLFECLEILKGKLHTAIQTCGYCAPEVFKKSLELCDYYLFDLKIMDDKEHVRHTGVSNAKIHKNFAALCDSGKDFVVRIPLIPTVTDTEENIKSIALFLEKHGIKYAELLPYNKIAGGKYAMTGRKYTPDFDETVEVVIRKEIFDRYGIEIKVL